jgi:uncharacterized lipoprotein YddW (UPF0748 family)
MKKVVVFCILISMLALFSVVAENYASSEPPVEGRGIWVWATSFKNAEELIGNFTLFKSLNLNIIFFLVKGWKPVYFNSSIRLRQPADWDPLKVAVEKAHELGLELHAWFVVFRDLYLAENRSLAMTYSDGTVDPNWTCPANPTVRSHLLRLIEEIVTKYDVDGIHLDYIRYNNSRACYCEYCREAYKNETGKEPPLNSSDPDWDNWTAWRIRQVTSFVQEAHSLIKNLKPNMKLSAYVLSNISDAVREVFQNWTDWIQKGFVDFLVPGAYTNNITEFEKRLAEVVGVLNTTNWKVPAYIGIGLHKFNETRDPMLIAEQVNKTRTQGIEGQAFFRYFEPCEPGYCNLISVLWEVLKMVYKGPALIPHSLNRVGLLITVDNGTYPLITYSNSTIENIYFNSIDKSINIIVSMPANTTGFIFIKLPESFIEKEWNGKIEVRLNGKSWQYDKITANSWTYIHIRYQDGLKEITITPEFANYLFIVTLIASTLLYLIYTRQTPKWLT